MDIGYIAHNAGAIKVMNWIIQTGTDSEGNAVTTTLDVRSLHGQLPMYLMKLKTYVNNQ